MLREGWGRTLEGRGVCRTDWVCWEDRRWASREMLLPEGQERESCLLAWCGGLRSRSRGRFGRSREAEQPSRAPRRAVGWPSPPPAGQASAAGESPPPSSQVRARERTSQKGSGQQTRVTLSPPAQVRSVEGRHLRSFPCSGRSIQLGRAGTS